MQIQGETTFRAPRERVWEVLLDPDAMARCMPGCQELRQVGDDTYAAVLRIGVGAVSGSFEGQLSIDEQEPPERYTMRFAGSGKQGFAKGSGETRLRADGEGTVVDYRCDVEVGGLLASVGHRVLLGVGRFLVKQMFVELRRIVEQEGAR